MIIKVKIRENNTKLVEKYPPPETFNFLYVFLYSRWNKVTTDSDNMFIKEHKEHFIISQLF